MSTEKTTEIPDHPFSADRPIMRLDEDLLGRSEFCRTLADSIRTWHGKESLVLGIYGQWGSGKTSVKNMIIDSLRNSDMGVLPVTEFNPWQWSGQTQIAEAFFREVGLALGHNSKNKSDKARADKWLAYASYLDLFKEAASGLNRLLLWMLSGGAVLFGAVAVFNNPTVKAVAIILAALCGALAVLLGTFKNIAEKITNIFVANGIRREKSLEDTRDALRELMLGMETPQIVIFDDIDRLAPHELKLVFQLVKSNADFPNLIYVLLFQRDLVEKSLEVGYSGSSVLSGREYLEKIINVGFDLPRIEQVKLDRYLDQQIDRIFPEVVASEADKQRFVNLYFDALQHFFSDLRGVKRFLATLDFHSGVFRARGALDINTVDFFAVEVLRVFEPDVYGALPTAKNLLLKTYERTFGTQQGDNKAPIDLLIQKASESNRTQVTEILKTLFPRIQSLYGGHGYGDGFAEEWLRECRICCSETFDRYFLLRIAEGDVSQADINRLINASNDKSAVLNELRCLKDHGLLSVMLDRFEAYKQTVPLSNAVPFVSALLEIGDELPRNSGGFFLSPEHHVSRIIYWFLKQEEDLQKRGDLLLQAASDSNGIFLVVEEAQSNDRDEEREKPKDSNDFLIDENSSRKLKRLALDRVRKAAASGKLVESHWLEYFLFRWKAWAGVEEPKTWCCNIIDKDEALSSLLVGFLSRSVSHALGDRVGRVNWRFDLKNLEQFVDVGLVEQRVSKLNKETLGEQALLAVDRFEKMLRRKKSGRPYGLDQMWHFRDQDDDE